MDFFEAQARAQKSTRRLVVLFSFGLLGTVLAGYVAALLLTSQWRSFQSDSSRHRVRRGELRAESSRLPLWQPRMFLLVAGSTVAVVGLASLYKWSQYSAGGGAVAESVGGRRIDPRTTDPKERRLLNVVEEMAIASGLPVPAVYLLPDEPGINAFAAGLTAQDAAVAVTSGTLEKLNRDELQGVIGHEFSHVLNGDMRLNLRIGALVFGILVIGLGGRGILWALSQGRIRTDRKGGGILVAAGAVGVALLVIGYVGYFFGRLIQAAVSRQREFLADASAVQFTRNPSGITGALKKIGGYALGSDVQSHRAGAIGHFFFAQGFRSSFGGLWATHPPLEERIRAIEPGFDGRFFEPPEVVDVAHESFVQAGLVAAKPAHQWAGQAKPGPSVSAFSPAQAVASIGQLGTEVLARAQDLLERIPPRLRQAAQTPAEVPALLYTLLLHADAGIRRRQLDLIASRAGGEAFQRVEQLQTELPALEAAHRLTLLQLSLPALKQVPTTGLGAFFDVLDDLVHVDGEVSIFEFTLQRLVLRALVQHREPDAQLQQIYSFQAVAGEIAVVLSSLAHTASDSSADAEAAFALGAGQLKLIESGLHLLPKDRCGLAQLEAALEKISRGSGPIKQRTLLAAATVVGADGRIHVEEAELLRALAATLDCPMPPLAAA